MLKGKVMEVSAGMETMLLAKPLKEKELRDNPTIRMHTTQHEKQDKIKVSKSFFTCLPVSMMIDDYPDS